MNGDSIYKGKFKFKKWGFLWPRCQLSPFLAGWSDQTCARPDGRGLGIKLNTCRTEK